MKDNEQKRLTRTDNKTKKKRVSDHTMNRTLGIRKIDNYNTNKHVTTITMRLSSLALFLITIFIFSSLCLNVLSTNFISGNGVIEPAAAEVEPEILGSGIGRFNSIIADDIDDDGRCELVFGNYEGYITILEYRGDDFFLEWQSKKLGHRAWGITVADFLGDSTKEIIMGNGDGEIYIFNAKTHKEIWYTDKFNNEDLIRDVHGLLVHNLGSNDTRYLLAGTGYKNDQDQGTIFIFKANGSNDVTEVTKIKDIDNRLRGVAVGDVDGDGELEIVFGSGVATGENPAKGFIRIYDVNTVLSTPDPSPEWKSKDLKGDCVALELLDFTGDGVLDILVGNGYRYQSGWVRILNYNQDSNDYDEFWKSDDIGPKPYGLAVGDIDGDGNTEIVVGNQPGYIYIFEHKGSTIKEEWRSKLLGSDILGLDLYNLDSDSQQEIIAAQGGYVGKGDYTSGYSEPHIYIIDGKTHKIEYTIGTTSWLSYGLPIIILVLILLLLIGLNFYLRYRKKIKLLKQREQ